MGQLGEDIVRQYSSMDADAQKHVAEADAILARPEFAGTNATFDAWMNVRAKPGRRAPREPEWYKVLGKESIRSIAAELQRLPEYLIYYDKGSKVVHSSAYKHQIKFGSSGSVGHPIRNLADAHTELRWPVETVAKAHSARLEVF